MGKKCLITSALLYVNGTPHLGHVIGCLLPADVCARFKRLLGDEVLFIGGTDEHGTASEVGALKAGLPVEVYCEQNHLMHRKLYEGLNLSMDYCGRTSSPQNQEILYRIFTALDKNGYITEKTIEQVYSIDDQQFLADRYIIGTCPYCGYENARGDQCEHCTKVLDPTDLKNARSAISGSTRLEVRKTKHLFLDLPKLQPLIEKWVKTKEFTWPDLAYTIAQKWLKEGLKERCITRDLKWGFPVNKPGYEDKVFYVWFDAPVGYIGITKQWSDEDPAHRRWEDWWLDADDVTYIEFMGKDNVPYHSVSFPATLMGTGEPWTLVSQLKGVSYLNFNGGKFSKSAGRGVFLDDALKEFPADYWRYWMMANMPETSDVNFKFDAFAGQINKDLNDVLGNFVNRVMKMTQSNFGLVVPAGGELTAEETQLYATLSDLVGKYTQYMNELEWRKALATLREIWVEGNNYIARTEPWKVAKVDKERAACILRTGLNLIRIEAILLAPIMPTFAKEILDLLKLPEPTTWVDSQNIAKEMAFLPPNAALNEPRLIFSKITPEMVTALSEKYHENEVEG